MRIFVIEVPHLYDKAIVKCSLLTLSYVALLTYLSHYGKMIKNGLNSVVPNI